MERLGECSKGHRATLHNGPSPATWRNRPPRHSPNFSEHLKKRFLQWTEGSLCPCCRRLSGPTCWRGILYGGGVWFKNGDCGVETRRRVCLWASARRPAPPEAPEARSRDAGRALSQTLSLRLVLDPQQTPSTSAPMKMSRLG